KTRKSLAGSPSASAGGAASAAAATASRSSRSARRGRSATCGEVTRLDRGRRARLEPQHDALVAEMREAAVAREVGALLVELDPVEPLEQRLERDACVGARELRTDAEVDAVAEGEVLA